MTWAECWSVAGWLLAQGRCEEGHDQERCGGWVPSVLSDACASEPVDERVDLHPVTIIDSRYGDFWFAIACDPEDVGARRDDPLCGLNCGDNEHFASLEAVLSYPAGAGATPDAAWRCLQRESMRYRQCARDGQSYTVRLIDLLGER